MQFYLGANTVVIVLKKGFFLGQVKSYMRQIQSYLVIILVIFGENIVIFLKYWFSWFFLGGIDKILSQDKYCIVWCLGTGYIYALRDFYLIYTLWMLVTPVMILFWTIWRFRTRRWVFSLFEIFQLYALGIICVFICSF